MMRIDPNIGPVRDAAGRVVGHVIPQADPPGYVYHAVVMDGPAIVVDAWALLSANARHWIIAQTALADASEDGEKSSQAVTP